MLHKHEIVNDLLDGCFAEKRNGTLQWIAGETRVGRAMLCGKNR